MRKPRLGFSRDIYEILQEHGPTAYHGIRQHLIAQGSDMKPKQTRYAISNLCQRGYVERSRKITADTRSALNSLIFSFNLLTLYKHPPPWRKRLRASK